MASIMCAHYSRRANLVTHCCNKVYPCHQCHDEREDHKVERKEIEEVICTYCKIRQNLNVRCHHCGIMFGNYTCLKCKIFDDNKQEKYHCDDCGICRIGKSENYFHCNKCKGCLPLELKNAHVCAEGGSRSNCPICLEDMHTSTTRIYIPPLCGHFMHEFCYKLYKNKGGSSCPICGVKSY